MFGEKSEKYFSDNEKHPIAEMTIG